jgi:Uma2 family endonuclease
MSTATVNPQPVTYGDSAALAKWSVGRYQQMIEAGILTAEDKVELLENHVVLKMPRNRPHDGTLDLVKAVLPGLLPPGWLVRMQQTVVLADSQPEPDFSIVRGTPWSYLTRHPGPADVGLIIEVADASLLRDQRDKTRIHARAGIAVYWIINLVGRRVEVYSQPSGPTAAPAYGAPQVYQPGDAVPLTLDGTLVGSIPVADMLP